MNYPQPLLLFADAEAGENPSEQIIRAERPGNFTQGMLSLAQIFGEQFACPGQGQLRAAMFQCRAGVT